MRLDHEYKLGNIDAWSSRSYFMALRDTVVCLNMGTSDANRDRRLFDQIADSFEPIERGVGIVFVRDESTPASFVTELLEDTFSYRPDQATQRLVRLNAQRECTVALVAEDEAERIVESLNERSKKAGYSAICRATG